MNTHNILQIVLAGIALAALPLTSWQFLMQEIDEKIERELRRARIEMQAQIDSHERTSELIRDYAVNLCKGVREIEPTFVCGSTYYRERERGGAYSNPYYRSRAAR